MAFDVSAQPIGQQLTNPVTIQAAESYLYTLVLYIITARNLRDVYNEFCVGTQISNLLFALNDPNIQPLWAQQIILNLNRIVAPYNPQVYPQLTL